MNPAVTRPTDADIFAVLRVFSADLKEVVLQGAIDPRTPIGQGWLRASHRQLDKKLSTRWRPYHTHAKKQPLKRGEVVALDIEIWPTSIVVPAGYRLALAIRATTTSIPARAGPAVEFQERADRLRAVPARRSARPPGRGFFSPASPACISTAPRGPTCCCRSFRQRKMRKNSPRRDNSVLYIAERLNNDASVIAGLCQPGARNP